MNQDFERETSYELNLEPPTRRLSQMAEHAFLVSLDTDGMFEHIYQLDRSTRIGRSAQCEIMVPVPACSRIHARIWREDGCWLIQDLGSSNGTYVNHVPIEREPLCSRDDIRIAGTSFRFLLPDEPELLYHRTVEQIASCDHLTGMNNREYLKRKMTAAIEGDTEPAFMIIDIDRFKLINDRAGHLAGDEVLIHVALRIQEACGDVAVAGRISGDEFGVVVPDVAGIDLATLADQICESVSRNPVETRGKRIPVTISVGVATMPPDQPRTTSNIMAAADEQLYRSKNGGRNKASVS